MSVSITASLVQVTTTKLQNGLLSLQDEGGNIVFIYNWISASFMSEQEEVNLAFCLATQAVKGSFFLKPLKMFINLPMLNSN